MSEGPNLTAFLFGSVDEQGRLENGMFDKESEENLRNLTDVLGPSAGFMSESGEELRRPDSRASATSDSCSSEISKASSCQDYSEINEAIEESPAACVMENGNDFLYIGDGYEADREDADSNEIFVDDDQALHALASLLPPEYKNRDPREFFPDFRKGKVLRFGRLFSSIKPQLASHVWRGVKSRRRIGEPQSEEEPSTSSSTQESSSEFRLNVAPTPPPEECETDDEIKQIKPETQASVAKKKTDESESKRPVVAPWRYGPAAYWYDQLGVPPSGEGFDYGFKLKEKSKAPEEAPPVEETPKEAFLLVNQLHWEDDIIWNPDDLRDEFARRICSGKQPLCGWIPMPQARTYEQFMALLKTGGLQQIFGLTRTPLSQSQLMKQQQLASTPLLPAGREPDPSFHIFPPDPMEFINTKWEDNIIWDHENMDRIPTPPLPLIDLTDESVVYQLPEDRPRLVPGDADAAAKDGRKDHHFTKKSQAIAGRVVHRKKQEEEEEELRAQMGEKDPFNLSNDEYYLPKSGNELASIRGTMIQHSIPAQNLYPAFFPTAISVSKLRQFHRLPLRRLLRGPVATSRFVSVQSCQRFMEKRQKERETERAALGGGDFFWMRTAEDISAKDGEFVLAEYSEEHPPLMMQPGMATKIRNYYKRAPGSETNVDFDFGETSYTHKSPFLGQLIQGNALQALENNLFRAPIYRHEVPSTDFLVIRTREGYFVREIPAIFVVGQECPLYEVPSPNSKRATIFIRDFLLVFIYRLFWQSVDDPKRLRMEVVRRAFIHYPESSIRKRLKGCADFKRLGTAERGRRNAESYWILRDDFRLPSHEEIRAMVTPEMYCAFMSMSAAEQRFKDAGYGEKYFFTPDDDDDEQPVKMEDEIKCAPWNTTRAFISAMRGKCLLDLTGPADPTGCCEGFSYVRVSSKPPKEFQQPIPKRVVTGTDADLRKLSLKDAKQLLREFGVSEEEIDSLTRWEIVDVIRTLSTQQAKSGGPGITKFARGNIRFNASDVQQRYQQECQQIFDLQNRILTSTEAFSSDEESSGGGDDSDVEEMGRDIETMLTKRQQIMHPGEAFDPEEERERLEFNRWLRGELAEEKQPTKSKSAEANSNRKLIIYRTLKDDKGQERVTEEVIQRPEVIDAYLKIRRERDAAFIKNFVQSSQEYKEEKRREKRRLQDRLRRLKRNELKVKQGLPMGTQRTPKKKEPKPPPPPKPSMLKVRCSACGAIGHMKTNRYCPLYGKSAPPANQFTMTDDQMEKEFSRVFDKEKGAIAFEGTKMYVKKHALSRFEQIKKQAVKMRLPVPKVAPLRLKKSLVQVTAERALKKSKLQAITPVQEFPRSFENLQQPSTSGGGADLPGISLKMTIRPEKKKRQPGSTTILPVKPASALTLAPPVKQPLLPSEYLRKMSANVDRRRTDPRVSMAVLLEKIVDAVRDVPEAVPFLKPVNAKHAPGYSAVVRQPIDLQTIRTKTKQSKYSTRQEFLRDVRLMVDNSIKYNGEKHAVTMQGQIVLGQIVRLLHQNDNKLMKLEKAINPLLDTDEKAFEHILLNFVERLRTVRKSHAFHHPVDRRKVKGYYLKISRPMDLSTMERKVKSHDYHSAAQFLADVELIYRNSETFNGPASVYTTTAKELYDSALKYIEENRTQLDELERNIHEAKEKAMAELDTESLASRPESRHTLVSDFLAGPSNAFEETGSRSRSVFSDDGKLSEGEIVESDDQANEMPDETVQQQDEDTIGFYQHEPDMETQQLFAEFLGGQVPSRMEVEGRIYDDLAMSDSDEDEPTSKKVRGILEDDAFDFSQL